MQKAFLYILCCLGVLGLVIGIAYIEQGYVSSPMALLSAAIGNAEERSDEVSLLAVGDIMLGRNVENLMKAHGDEYPFTYIKPLLQGSDVVFANFEGTVADNHVHTKSGGFQFSFPLQVPKLLYDNNIKIVNLANNHGYDFGGTGYDQTRAALSKAGIESAGHPYVFGDDFIIRKTIKGKNFIFLGFNATNPKFDPEAVLAYVQALPHDPHDFIIAMVHGGTEYHLHSNEFQQGFYESLIDVGVDAVIAHHPHVVEEVELYKNKPIFYSLGNFIFDQYFSKDVQQELSVKITVKNDSVNYELIPLKSTKSQPREMTEDEKEVFLTDLAARSPEAIRPLITAGSFNLVRD